MKKYAYILTQMPMPSTVIDFYRLIWSQQVSSIVMLNRECDLDEVGQQANRNVSYLSQNRQCFMVPKFSG